MRPLTRLGVLLLAMGVGPLGCDSFRGPSLDYVAPRVTGTVVNDVSGEPAAWARVGRRLFKWRKSGGEFLKGGEELMVWQDYVRTTAQGDFTLPAKKVALLFSLGELGIDMNLSVRHSEFSSWHTNFPMEVLNASPQRTQPAIDGLIIRLEPK